MAKAQLKKTAEAKPDPKAEELARAAGAAVLAQLAKKEAEEKQARMSALIGKIAPLLQLPRPRVFTPQGVGTLRGMNLENAAPVIVSIDYDTYGAKSKTYSFYLPEVEPAQVFKPMLEELFKGVQQKGQFDPIKLEIARKNHLVVVTKSDFVTLTPSGIEQLLELRQTPVV